MNQRAAIREAATDVILSLPEVIAAAGVLNQLSHAMQATAQQLPRATGLLTTTAAVLSIAQQFSDVIATAHLG